MEPQTQYVRSADGTTIATHRLGGGSTPLVVVPRPLGIGTFSNYWPMPDMRAGYSGLAERRLVVAYDTRGQGFPTPRSPTIRWTRASPTSRRSWTARRRARSTSLRSARAVRPRSVSPPSIPIASPT
jgi:hypothetical protein